MTSAASWLNESFSGFDHLFLSIQHFFGDKLGVVLTPLMKLITFLGEKGWIFFVLALLFMLMADRRDFGVCIFGAVCCGALITNIILKDSIARLRPFDALKEYQEWWKALGSPGESGYSFPSGHVTACAAGMTAITLMRGKKWIIPSCVAVLLMAISRNYLMAHYPSDVLAAALIGVFSGVVAWFITQLIFRFLRRNRKKKPICGTILDFDVRDVLPFRLPALPFLKGTARRAAPAPRTSAPAGMDDDVKTYPGPADRKAAKETAEAAPASDPAPAPAKRALPSIRLPALGSRAAKIADKPAHAAAPAQTVGKHVKESPAQTAKKTARFTIPGAYQGKH